MYTAISRKETEEVLNLYMMVADDSECSSDSDEEEELELLFLQLAYPLKRDTRQCLNIDLLSEVDFELLFR